MGNSYLLAIDLGVKTGFAVFSSDPSIISYGSRNYGNASRLRRATKSILHEIPDLAYLVIEGGGPLAMAWTNEASKLGLQIILTSADEWRARVFWQRDYRSGEQAKLNAVKMARLVIKYLGGTKPLGPMKDDAAEAILTGWWAMEKLGWIPRLPRLTE